MHQTHQSNHVYAAGSNDTAGFHGNACTGVDSYRQPHASTGGDDGTQANIDPGSNADVHGCPIAHAYTNAGANSSLFVHPVDQRQPGRQAAGG
ncbi:MAG: hypothetical protein JXM73_23420 [Anaerolineae bacterium]|nr:hypothetical protein [Anaerolineae bacterium]